MRTRVCMYVRVCVCVGVCNICIYLCIYVYYNNNIYVMYVRMYIRM